jgi:hypothetical protein
MSTIDSSTTSSALFGDSAAKLPKLDERGSNWLLYKKQVQTYIIARKLGRHLDGRAKAPTMPPSTPADPAKPSGVQIPPTEKEMETYEDGMDDFDVKQAATTSILLSTLPETLKLKVIALTPSETWTFLCSQFEHLGELVQVDILTQMNDVATPEGDDPRPAIDQLEKLKAEYASAGGTLPDAQWHAMVLRSLPKTYKEMVRNLLALRAAQASLVPAGTPQPVFAAADLINIVRMAARDDKSLEAKAERQSALAARTSHSGKPFQNRSNSGSGGSSGGFGKPKCSNCGKKGHAVGDCWAPGGGKAGQGPNQSGGGSKKGGGGGGGGAKANAATTRNFAFSVATNFAQAAKAGLPHLTRLLDTGATRHFDPTRENFVTFREIEPVAITSAEGRTFYATGEGDVPVSARSGDASVDFTLKNVLYAPSMPMALVSVSRMTTAGFPVHFETDGAAHVLSPARETFLKVAMVGGLYPIVGASTVASEEPVAVAAAAVTSMTLTEFHERMGHAYAPALKDMVKNGVITGIDLTDGEAAFCPECLEGKQKREPFPKKSGRAKGKTYGHHVHSDVWGPARTQSPTGSRYFSSFLDDKTDELRVAFMKEKSQTFTKYKSWVAWAKNHRDMKSNAVFQSDRGGEYLSKTFSEYLDEQGTERRLTVHDSPQSNGKSERINDTIVGHGRAMLHKAGLPMTLWCEAIHHAVWLRNRTTTVNTPGSTPHEQATGEKPNLANLRLFGEVAYVLVKPADKLGARSQRGVWVGYDDESKGHRIWWTGKNRVSVERDVKFDPNAHDVLAGTPDEGEHEPRKNADALEQSAPERAPTTSKEAQDASSVPTSTPAPVSSPAPSNTPAPARPNAPERSPSPPVVDDVSSRPKRARQPSAWLRDVQAGKGSFGGRGAQKVPASVAGGPDEAANIADAAPGATEQERVGADPDPPIFALAAMAGDEPTYWEAAKGSETEQWREAMKEELAKIKDRGTFELVPPPPPKQNVVGNVWVLRKKRDAANNVTKYKARLCAQGFSQIPGVDFHDTSAPTCRLSSLRYVLALAARHDLELHHIDFKNAYLYGDLDETIYMRQPRGFEQPGKRDWVWRLIKALYGLKQAGRLWYEKVKALFASFGLSPSDYDTCVFEYWDGDIVLVIAVHVDDCTVATDSPATMAELKAQLDDSGFEIADLGEAQFLLGLEIRRDRAAGTIALTQRAYIDTLVERFEMQDAKAAAVPADPHVDLTAFKATDEDRAVMKSEPYSALIGSLMYAAIGTRFDVQFVTSTLSRFMSDPARTHLDAAKRVLRYLKGTRDLWLVLGTTRDGLQAYTDSDWASAAHRHSISGAVFVFDGAAFQWYSRKQSLVALSSTEAEYIAQSEAVKELEHFIYLQDGLPFAPLGGPPTLYSDNQSAIALARSGHFSHRTKHIHVKYRHVQSALERGILDLEYLPTEEMVADMMTKPLPRVKLEYFRELGGLRPLEGEC